MILRKKKPALAEVPLSPLIDCVFLLLIFFLVTSMLRKTEKQLPVQLPDSQLSVAGETDQQVLTLGIDRQGGLSIGRRGTTETMLVFEPLPDLPAFLHDLQSSRGTDVSIQLAVEAGTETQVVIDLLDQFQRAGFGRVSVRMRSDDHVTENLEGR